MTKNFRRVFCMLAVMLLAALATAAPEGTRASDGAIVKGQLDTLSAEDLDRHVGLENLYQAMLAGSPVSLEERWILERYGWGDPVQNIEADVVISRALYDQYIRHVPLSLDQQKLMEVYEQHAASRANGIADYKEWLRQRNLEAAATATPRATRVAPPNDLCAGAEVIPAAGPFPYLSAVTADITDATATGDPTPLCQTNWSRGIWYVFTPSTTALYTLSVCADAPTGTTVDDTVLAVFTSSDGTCAGTFTQVTGGCDDDSCTSESLQSVITGLPLTAGTTYYILAYKFDITAPTVGNTAVQLRISQALPPANDTCASAITLYLNTPVAGTTVLAANDYQVPAANPPFTGLGQTTTTAPGRDVVYTFTAPAAGTYSFRVTGFSFNTCLYVTNVCPPSAPPTFNAADCLGAANRNSNTSYGSEEVMCVNLAAAQTVWVIVDEFAFDTGSVFVVEVTTCTLETEANGTPATANTARVDEEGSITPAADADFYSLGTPAAGSRVFAMLDGIAANSTDFDLRVTTATDTLEYDDANNDAPFGSLAANVAGTPLTGVASYLRVNHFSTTTQSEPYRLYYVVQPDPVSATAESEPNDTPATADASRTNYFAGALSATTDVDIFKFKAFAGELIYLGLDLDPTRTNNPFNGKLDLLDSAGILLVAVFDGGGSSSITPGTGNLAATNPSSPAEAIAWRARYTGVYYARVSWSSGTNVLDYLLSIANLKRR